MKGDAKPPKRAPLPLKAVNKRWGPEGAKPWPHPFKRLNLPLKLSEILRKLASGIIVKEAFVVLSQTMSVSTRIIGHRL